MSTNLYWRPAPKNQPPPWSVGLAGELKTRLSQRLWGHDGSLGGDEIEIGKEWGAYLEGLADAGTDGAAELLAAIDEHERVLVWIGE